jgi:DNA polymerase-3 subunit gamma/tau
MAERYQVLSRRYRPQKFCDVIGQQAIIQTLKNAIRKKSIANAYLFSGSRGIGKTTLARLFAKALNCLSPHEGEPCNQCASCLDINSGQSLDVIEIDGASNRGIDDIRQINETVAFAPSHGQYKIYIIDEVHMLTKEAFNALLKTLEEPPERAKFFFATTEPHKILPTILSRCQRFDLKKLSKPEIECKLLKIAQDLNRKVESDAIALLAKYADGALRDAESLFDQILCFTSDLVKEKDVRNALGLAPQELFEQLDLAFTEARVDFAFDFVQKIDETGKDPTHILSQLIEHYRNHTELKAKKLPNASPFYTLSQTLFILDLLLKAETVISKSISPIITLESTVLQILRSKHRIPVEVLIKRISELEEELKKTPLCKKNSEPDLLKPLLDQETNSNIPFHEKVSPNSIHEPQSPPLDSKIDDNKTDQNVLTNSSKIDEKTISKPTFLIKENKNQILNPIETQNTLNVTQIHEQTQIIFFPETSYKEKTPDEQIALTTNLKSAVPLAPSPNVELIEMPDSIIKENQLTNENIKLEAIPFSLSEKALTPGIKSESHYKTLIRFAAVELEGTVKS